ncbi:hypothetical protein [Helicobacter pylori]|uniref:hypothetical protein n=1 Tax=Helicobacter pylori TaxID=210 RepID=UPI0018837FB5|nr:hypothetical protein [Helicobacter pylori]
MMNTDRQDYNQYNLLTPLTYGGVVEYNKSNQKKQNAQIRELIRELNSQPSKDKLQQTYTLILASIILQNTSILKDIYTRYMNTQYKQSNPNLTQYEIDLIANHLYEVYQIRKDYTNERLKDMVKKDYNTQLALLSGLIVGSRNSIVKHPTAKAIGLPWLMLPIGKVWFSLCVPNHRDFTEFDLQRIPYRSHTSYLQRRNFAHFLR